MFCSPVYPQYLAQYLAHNRPSIILYSLGKSQTLTQTGATQNLSFLLNKIAFLSVVSISMNVMTIFPVSALYSTFYEAILTGILQNLHV